MCSSPSRRAVFSVFLCAAVFLSTMANAASVIIEPDDYASGTDLSDISPYVSLRTSGGNPVYASTIDKTSSLAAGGYSTGPLGSRVFSSAMDTNSEWSYWPDFDPGDPLGLAITFAQPVSSFSLLFAELFNDAGCCTADPINVYIYAPDGSFIESVWGDQYPADGILGTAGNPADEWPYWLFNYSANLVGKVIVGGVSEPTSIDRLEFSPVPVPAAVWLFCTGLLGLVGFAGRNAGRSAFNLR